MQVDKDAFWNKIKAAENIAMFGHIRPDGDCVGSCLGLYNYIMDNIPGKKITVYLQSMPDSFAFLRYYDKVCGEADDKVYDLAISLDCSDRERHGEFMDIYGRAKDSICLDHHKSNQGFGDYYYCDPDASATCEIVYRFLDDDKISRYCAECLYLGIVHDTGVFKYSATSEETMKCAGRLMSKGINTQRIIDDTFYKVSYNQNRMKAQAVLDSKLYLDGKLIATCVNLDMFERFNTTRKDVEGIVDQIRLTEGIEVAVFAYQLEENKFKFSMRSIDYVDVSEIAVAFGGGGHIRAAGFDVNGGYEEVLGKVIDMVKTQL
jgi:phosphoesterase RecJ-like protein